MKRLIFLISAVIILAGSGCTKEETEPTSTATYDFHISCVEHLGNEGLLLAKEPETFDAKWIEKAFVESWIKTTNVNDKPEYLDIVIYIHLQVDNGLTLNSRYFYLHFYTDFEDREDEKVEVSESSYLTTKTNTIFGYQYTDKIDKQWS